MHAACGESFRSLSSSSRARGWGASQPAPELLAAEVPPGQHALAFTFERPLWTWLLWLLPFVVAIVARRFTFGA